MSSTHVEDFLTDYIDGTLTGATLDKVKSHLVFCTNCRQLHQDLVSNISRLKATPKQEPSPQLEKRILAYLADNHQATQTRTEMARPTWLQWFLSFRGMSLAGAVVLLIFVVQNAPKMQQESKIEVPKLSKESVVVAKTPLESNEKSAIPSDEISIKDVPTAPIEPPEENALKTESSRSVPSAIMHSDDKGRIDSAARLNMENSAGKIDLQKRSKTADMSVGQPQVMKANENASIPIDNQSLSGNSSGITQPLEKVISDPNTWQDYWARHQKGKSPPEPLPYVDFEKNDVIAIFGGEQPTLGFRIEITKVILTQWENAPARVIRYRLISPPTGSLVGQMISQPYCFKIVPKAEGPTFFKKIR